MRDPEKVKIEMAKKDEIILDAAKKLFLEKSIEAVKMDEIVAECGFGRATVFRHYKSKCMLVISLLSREWKKRMDSLDDSRPIEGVLDIPAIDRFIYTLDFYIDMYQNYKDLLILNENFNHYIVHAVTDDEREALASFEESIASANKRFHLMYEKAKEDKTLRTDMSEDEFIRITIHTMMAACSHYAGGFVWGAKSDKNADYTRELISLKEMLIHYATTVV